MPEEEKEVDQIPQEGHAMVTATYKLRPVTLEPPPPEPEPIYTCDICNAQVPDSGVYSYIVQYARTGHPFIAAFQCPAQQHWGCTPEHAMEAAIACMQEHLHPLLLDKHETANS